MSSDATAESFILLERVFTKYAEDFAGKNVAAKVLTRGLSLVGVGIRPLLDHMVFRSLRPKERAQEFLDLGYEKDPAPKLLCGRGRGADVYRNGCAPAILIKCPHDKPGQDWVNQFGDKDPYVLAVRVEDVDDAAFRLEKQSVAFLRPPAGKKEESLRQIAAASELQQGLPANYLVLVERHAGDRRFYLPGFWEQV